MSTSSKFLACAFFTTAALFAFSAIAAEKPVSSVPADYKGKPFGKEPIAVPGTVIATEYDVSPDNANGIAYNYNSAPKPGNIRKDGIGITNFGKGHVTTKGEGEKPELTYLGWTHTGEWTKYTLKVKEAGTYQIGGRFAAANKGGKISFSFTPNVTTGPVEIPTTAGFQPGVEVYHVWEKLDNLAEVKLPAGETVMTVKIEVSGGFNIESITLTKKP